jgi:adhesin transport system membrane fusion protein
MSRLDNFLETHPLPTWRRVAWPVMILLATFVVWAEFGKLDEVAVAPGEVVPQGKLKVIQHLEGGIVEDIFVKEGDKVREGTRLVQLNLATGSGNRNELLVRKDAQALIKARLEAQSKGTKLAFPEDVAKRQQGLLAAQQQAYDS